MDNGYTEKDANELYLLAKHYIERLLVVGHSKYKTKKNTDAIDKFIIGQNCSLNILTALSNIVKRKKWGDQ